jgi:hypothetical protein
MEPPRTRPAVPAARPAATVDPTGPHDTCFRCGRPTPLGVSLCEEHNPAGIGAPSATQVHGTIFIGIVLGFVALAALAQLLLGGLGPFDGRIVAARSTGGGGAELSLLVTNGGTREARANCRVTRGGVSTSDDVTFQTDPIPAGETISVTRQVPPPRPGNPPYVLDRFAISCA